MDEVSTIVEVILGLGTAFGGGFAVGKYSEKWSIRHKLLEQKINKIENNLFKFITSNPKMTEWIKENPSQIMDLINAMTKEEEK